MNRRRRLALAAVRRRHIRTALHRIAYVLALANRTLELAHGPFVFACPRCAQRYRVARLMITPLRYGLKIQHELPPCDAFQQREHLSKPWGPRT
jgi:hypothetical protein